MEARSSWILDSGTDVPPPPPRAEAVPASRPGFTWVPGFWDRQNQRYVWVVGHRVAERRGYHWLRHRWVLRDGRWHLLQGGWAPDAWPAAPALHAVAEAR
jgi:hypothetical protein